MRKLISILWIYLVVCFATGFIFTLDSETGGLRGLMTPENLLSVSLVALVLTVPLIVAVWVCRKRGIRSLALLLVSFALIGGLALTLLGSSATSTGGRLVSFIGTTGIALVVLLMAMPPAVFALRASRPE